MCLYLKTSVSTYICFLGGGAAHSIQLPALTQTTRGRFTAETLWILTDGKCIDMFKGMKYEMELNADQSV